MHTSRTLNPITRPLYVHSESNHPPPIPRNIPFAVNKRLNKLSSDKESFNKAAPLYQHAQDESGYAHKLEFDPTAQNNQARANSRARTRNITCFNPPFSKNISTNVGRKFLNIAKECFKDGHPLKKIFNKNTLKVSYSCMPNLDSKIKAHNKVLLDSAAERKPDEKLCNCRVKARCPLGGKCLTKEVVYQATVTSAPEKATASLMTSSRSDTATTYRHSRMRANETLLSLVKLIWPLKDRNIDYTLTWNIIA